jgi:hypothetical protein
MGDRGPVQWELKRLVGGAVEKVRQCRTALASMLSKQFHLHTVDLYCVSHPLLLDHLIQSCCPEDLQEALRPFDDTVLTTAKLALRLDLADQIALRRARLPPLRSGLLLRQRGGHGGGFLPDSQTQLSVGRSHRRSRPLQIGPARLGSSRSSWTWWVQAPLSRAGGGLRTSYHAKEGCRLADELEGAWGRPQSRHSHCSAL